MKNNLNLLIALFILFTAFLSFQSQVYTGRVITDCQDSDSTDLFTKGTTTAAGDTLEDYCVDETTVVEYYCVSGDLQVKVSSCGAGCQNGACNKDASLVTVPGKKSVSLGSVTDQIEINEFIGDVRSAITEDDTNALQSGVISTPGGSTTYEQTIRFETTGVLDGKILFAENDDNDIDDFLTFFENNITFEYAVDFSEGLESELVSSHAVDLEDEDLALLDRTYKITEVKTSGNRLTIKLVSGDVPSVLEEGDKKQYLVQEKTFDIEVLVIDDTKREATLMVNGKKVSLSEGEMTIINGIGIGVQDLLISEVGEGKDKLILYLGAETIEFEDDDYTDSNFKQSMKVNGKSISNGYTQIKATTATGEIEILSIKYRMKPEGNQGNRIFVGAGKGLRSQLKYPEAMLGNWDIIYNGLSSENAKSMIKFDPSGSTYDLEFENNKGNFYDIPLIANVNGNLQIGSSNNILHFVESASSSAFTVAQNDYMVLTNRNDKNGVTSIVRYTSINTASKLLHIDELEQGGKTVTYTGTEGTGAAGDLIVNGHTYRIFIGPAPDYKLAVDLNNDGDVAVDEVNIVTKGGGKLDLGINSTPNNSFNITLTTEKSQFDSAAADEVITIEILKSGSSIDLNLPAQSSLTIETVAGKNLALSNYGITFKQKKDNPDELTIEYPHSQAVGDIEVAFFTTPSATTEIKKPAPKQPPTQQKQQTLPPSQEPIPEPQVQVPSQQEPPVMTQKDSWYLRWWKKILAWF
ncbi:MAG: hypothetical protein AABW64_02550 [Nanoarchaeota archaeon]